jgi:hypothetical protein
MPDPKSTDGEFITLKEGGEYTQRYRNQFTDPTTIIKGHLVGRNKVDILLKQDGAVGLRMYYGLTEDNEQCIVLVAVDKNGDDMTELIVERLKPCPPYCSSGNALNGN